jgi:hypothetical protein
MTTVQKKNLLRVMKYVTEQIEIECEERIPAEIDTINSNGPILSKVKISIGNRGFYDLELTYPNQED